jgi:hypothetical protein
LSFLRKGRKSELDEAREIIELQTRRLLEAAAHVTEQAEMILKARSYVREWCWRKHANQICMIGCSFFTLRTDLHMALDDIWIDNDIAAHGWKGTPREDFISNKRKEDLWPLQSTASSSSES